MLYWWWGELAERMGKSAYLVDNADQLEKEWFKQESKIGVTAGASAPEILIKQVIQRLQDWGATPPKELNGREENITFSLPKEYSLSVFLWSLSALYWFCKNKI